MRSTTTAHELASLLRRASTGDQTAFAGFYDRTAERAFALAQHILRGSAPAEQVTREAYLELWRTCDRLETAEGSALGHLMLIVCRRAVDRAFADEVGLPASVVVAELSDRQRQALFLSYF